MIMIRLIQVGAIAAVLVASLAQSLAQPCVPETELCNGLDDDCDGVRDGISEPCYPFDSGCAPDDSGGWICSGLCQAGHRTCTAIQTAGGTWQGQWSICQGAIGPSTEICDGQDDDCDGEADDAASCPGGSQCIDGTCVIGCGGGDFVCPPGHLCVDGWCVPDPCDRVACSAAGWVCRNGECVDPCQGVTCGRYESCVMGACVDTSCYNPENACAPGRACVQGVCRADPCANVDCDASAYCDDGTCVQLCDTIACPAGQVCRVVLAGGKPQTECVADPCADLQCGTGFVCQAGACVEDPCETVTCDPGQICREGRCLADRCETIHCPRGYSCEGDTCVSDNPEQPPEPPDAPPDDDPAPTVERGCTCRLGSDGPGPLLLLTLVALLITRRGLIRIRRRRSRQAPRERIIAR